MQTYRQSDTPIVTGYLVDVKTKISFLRITKVHNHREAYTICSVTYVTRIICCLAYIRPCGGTNPHRWQEQQYRKERKLFYERYCANLRKSKPNIGRSGGVFQYWDGKDQRVVQHRGLSICSLGWKQAHDKAQENGGVSRWRILNLKLNQCPWCGMITIPYRALFGKELLCQRSARIIKGVF